MHVHYNTSSNKSMCADIVTFAKTSMTQFRRVVHLAMHASPRVRFTYPLYRWRYGHATNLYVTVYRTWTLRVDMARRPSAYMPHIKWREPAANRKRVVHMEIELGQCQRDVTEPWRRWCESASSTRELSTRPIVSYQRTNHSARYVEACVRLL